MDDIAVASGISRRTLFRHFAAKSDLVWRDFFVTYARMSERVASDPPPPGVAGLREVVREGLVLDADAERHARVCLGIIGDSPEVFAAGIGAMSGMRDGLARHFSRGSEADGVALEPWISAYAVIAAMLAASVWWAKYSDEPIAAVVDRALERLEQGLS